MTRVGDITQSNVVMFIIGQAQHGPLKILLDKTITVLVHISRIVL
jgi:hypothetical protein